MKESWRKWKLPRTMKAIKFSVKFLELIEIKWKTQTRRLINKNLDVKNRKPKYEIGDVVEILTTNEWAEFDDTFIEIRILHVSISKIEDITEDEARKEGVRPYYKYKHYDFYNQRFVIDRIVTAKEQFLDAIYEIYKVREGDCFVYEFELIKK